MSTPTRYGFWLRNLHWVIATLVIGALTLVELHGLAPRGSALRSDMMYAHMQFGMAVLLLFLPRLIVRLSGQRPAVVPKPPWWLEVPGKTAHVVFYVLMLVQPLVGILMVESSGHPVAFLGMQLPTLVSPDKGLNHTLGDLHAIGGNIFLWLVILHASAAFFHHWGRKDNLLRRMIYSRS